MTDERRELAKKRTLVVKIGSRTLATRPQLPIDVAQDFAGISKPKARRIVLVSSGAIALGMKKLGFGARPKEMAKLQAAAAAGQSVLMSAYDRAFAAEGLTVAQVLLTHADFADRTRANNARGALSALLDAGAIPILNENDSVSVEEIKFGDNDQLAAMVTPLVDAQLLVLLSDVEGVRDGNGQRLSVVTDVRDVLQHVQASKSDVGTGGMASKLEAARQATLAGAHVVIADAREPGIVGRILAGEDLGTLFLPAARKLSAKKHWIAFTLRPRGALLLDAGAVRAITERGKSLLPMGVLGVRGVFQRGDAVVLSDSQGREVGRARVGMGALEALAAIGPQKAPKLGDKEVAEIAHRDDMVLWPD